MAKKKTPFVCTECGETFSQWLGKCSNCGAFNTLKEFREAPLSEGDKISPGMDLIAQESQDQDAPNTDRMGSGLTEVDRVLGGGFFPGSVLLFGGHPGIGKSTLSLQMFLEQAAAFYFSGEESTAQIIARGERINTEKTKLAQARILATHSLEDIVTTLEKHRPPIAIIDSIQMVGTVQANFGSTSQIRENAEILVKTAKATGTTILMIGHVTKNEELAGPKILEHIVDTVLYLEGDSNSDIRILRAQKNRFGSTMEIGVFEMKSSGLSELINPSEFFLAERADQAHGSVISVIREGARNFLLEVQVLTVKTNFGQPRRTAGGISLSKFHLLCAVISKFSPFKMEAHDGYVNIVGGFRVAEPAADLAICAALLSSRAERDIPADTVIFGEVGLSGEVRSVPHFQSRVAEAEKLGFKKIICPRLPKDFKNTGSVQIRPVKNIPELMREILES